MRHLFSQCCCETTALRGGIWKQVVPLLSLPQSMFDWAAEAWKLDAANENDPPQLLESGSADGAGLELDLNSFVDFGSSNIASLQRGRSSRFGDVVVKCARASHKLPPHDVRNEARLMSQLKHPNVRPSLHLPLRIRSKRVVTGLRALQCVSCGRLAHLGRAL